MPRVHTVQKSRKEMKATDGSIIPVGSTYYWWKFRYGPKLMSLTPPKPAQLTRSEYAQALIGIREAIDAIDRDDIQGGVQGIIDELENLKSECEDKLSNMPEQLQDSSDSGMMLQERIDELDGWISDFESVDTDELDEQTVRDEVVEEVRAEIVQDLEDELADEQESGAQDEPEDVMPMSSPSTGPIPAEPEPQPMTPEAFEAEVQKRLREREDEIEEQVQEKLDEQKDEVLEEVQQYGP